MRAATTVDLESKTTAPSSLCAFEFDPASAKHLGGGYSGNTVIQVSERASGKPFVIKQSQLEQNINAVVVSQLLKKLLEGRTVLMDDKKLTYHVPEVRLTYLHGKLAQLQEHLDGLNTRIEGRLISGLTSFQNIEQMAEFGIIYQFLVLGDNMAYNHRYIASEQSINIFDFDAAFRLGGHCHTDSSNPFADDIHPVGHAYNHHFIELLALRHHHDKYHSGARYRDRYLSSNSTVKPLGDETWADFFKGVVTGLQHIKASISTESLKSEYGAGMPAVAQAHLSSIRELLISRLNGIDPLLMTLEQLLSGRQRIAGLDLSTPIATKLDEQIRGARDANKAVYGFLNELKQNISKLVAELASTPKSSTARIATRLGVTARPTAAMRTADSGHGRGTGPALKK